MKVPGTAPEQKKHIFVRREQIELAMKQFLINDPSNNNQSGWYRFSSYATRLQMSLLELSAMSNRIDELNSENAALRKMKCDSIPLQQERKDG